DITSLDYSYSFDEKPQQEWEWSEKFATQPEILRYVEHVVERIGLEKDIRFNSSVTAAEWDPSRSVWTVSVTESDDDGVPREGAAVAKYTAKFLILAVGNLSATHTPDIPGI